MNLTHTLNISHKKSKSSFCEECFCGIKRASVKAARMTENASLSVTNQPASTVRPDRTQKKCRCNATAIKRMTFAKPENVQINTGWKEKYDE